MEQKVTAKELLDIVTDTNNKVTVMVNGQQDCVEEEKKCSTFGMVMAVLFIILGAAMTVASIFQQIAGASVTFFVSKDVWSLIYVEYALSALVIMSLTRIYPSVRLIALLSAIAPLCISFLVPIF